MQKIFNFYHFLLCCIDFLPKIGLTKFGAAYIINGYLCLVIGGAYSVDKYYRIARRPNSNWTGWFAEEQLNDTERATAANLCKNKSYDFVLSHTCPISWEPRDLFLSTTDQSSVDKTMELWMEDIKLSFSWNIWLFGHYHADRLERPHIEQLYKVIENIDDIWYRWHPRSDIEEFGMKHIIDRLIRKSPNYYIDM